ncbi:MAG: glutamyl-tRNA reductase [Candidatus Sericytochromatia bacterium]|nr:glutamyl-tRNA reductase [Candidatus Sericytochromatia bacterium]
MQLVLVGANYKSAGLDTRELLTFSKVQLSALLDTLSETAVIEEALVMSTCNRSEVYVISRHPEAARQLILDAISELAGVPENTLETLLYTYYNKFAATHLFDVACGLDSMVLGEDEILRQVKTALDIAQLSHSSGPILNQLFRAAVTAGKRVRSETAINQGCTSLSAVAARLLRRHLEQKPAHLLIVGAGQMARTLIRNLEDTDIQISLANRTRSNAEALAESSKQAIQLLNLDQLASILPQVQAVVTCTALPDFLITPDFLPNQALMMIDLAVPRNIDPGVTQQPGITLYDVDSLQNQVEDSLLRREQNIGQAQSIIGEEATRFLDWLHQREMAPTIRGLYSTFEDIRQRETTRALQKCKEPLTAEHEALIQQITRAITQKILHYPVVRLKNADAQTQQIYHEVLSELFGLNAEDEIDRYVQFRKISQPLPVIPS